MSGPELARRLEVSPRSVRRYVAMLQDMGIPIEGARGRYGQYRLRAGYKLPPLMFTDDEALAVVLGLLLVRRSGSAVEPHVAEGALAKVDRVLPDAIRRQVEAVQETLVFEAPRHLTPPVSEQVMVLSSGVKDRRRVWIRYRRDDGEQSEREIDPYGVVHLVGRWYTVGYCHLRQDLRVFRLDRVEHAELLGGAFVPPEAFDPVAYIAESIATIPSRYRVEVLLKTTLARARTLVPPVMATLQETSDGVIMRCTADGLDWLAADLAGLECAWEVREPPELREALRRRARLMLEQALVNEVAVQV